MGLGILQLIEPACRPGFGTDGVGRVVPDELRLKMETLSVGRVTAQALLMQEDMRDFSAARLRATEQLGADFRDNFFLAN